MKIVEPISSALLITGCVYSAGISQNNAFMREFGINPEFSQPSIDKILYDGGLITFEIFYDHLKFLSLLVFVIAIFLVATWAAAKLISPGSAIANAPSHFDQIKSVLQYTPTGLLLLLYIIYLCFSSYQKSQETGIKLSETFMERCHWVILKDKKNTTKACAFRKDKDSIWYYNIKGGDLNINSSLLTELGQVTYLEPQKNSVASESHKDKKEGL
ncbi:hypothetical protein CQ065_23395 [Pseudomonas sp. MYb187]|uniref:hypothetical protein n=1 Tax=Pseudomonas TaxID=286 RepID=UPI000CFD79B3|nr:hypothetical protein [Pseudomonas sp. MYb187]PRA58665.1 hypothetical protein CQ065_23395 [Pseudomonas sp. MYb187]